MSADNFSYWYISIFLIFIGVAGVIASRSLNLLKCNFWLELRDPTVAPRLRAVLDRRDALEGLGQKPVLVASISYLFFGILCLLHILTPAITYALACADVALVFAWVYTRVRNRSQRRAASLAPRRQISVVSPLAFIGALLSAAIPLLFVTDATLRAPALLVSLSSLAIVAAAWSIAGMAAVLVGEDVDLEVYVDERIRRSRVGSMLALAYAVASGVHLGRHAERGGRPHIRLCVRCIDDFGGHVSHLVLHRLRAAAGPASRWRLRTSRSSRSIRKSKHRHISRSSSRFARRSSAARSPAMRRCRPCANSRVILASHPTRWRAPMPISQIRDGWSVRGGAGRGSRARPQRLIGAHDRRRPRRRGDALCGLARATVGIAGPRSPLSCGRCSNPSRAA